MPVPLLLVQVLVIVLRRFLHLLLGAGDEYPLLVRVDSLDHTCRKEHPPAEDPRPGVNHDAAGVNVPRGFVDLADRTVPSLDIEPDDIELVPDRLPKHPHLDLHLATVLSRRVFPLTRGYPTSDAA